VRGKVKSLHLGKVVCAEIARLMCVDMTATVSDTKIDTVLQEEVIFRIIPAVEFGLALGGVIFKPCQSTENTVTVQLLTPFDYQINNISSNNKIKDIIFFDEIIWDDIGYRREERHIINASKYTITNTFYRTGDGDNGDETKLTNWAHIEPWTHIKALETIEGLNYSLFGYFTPAMADTEKLTETHGVSVLTDVEDTIQRCDEQLSYMIREFRAKQARVMVSPLAAPENRGSALPDLEDDLYIKVGIGAEKNQEFFNIFTPQIYVSQYREALNEYKRQVEDIVGLAHGAISEIDRAGRTATELRIMRHRSFVTVSNNQRNLQHALEDLANAVNYLLHDINAKPITISFSFDETTLEDWGEKVKRMFNDVSAGLIKPEKYLMEAYSLTEEEARKWLPSADSLVNNDNDLIIR